MPISKPWVLGGKNVAAFLDAIAYAEGTDNGTQVTKCMGYDVIVGGNLFTNFSKHPEVLVRLSPTLSSSAAGRYQFIRRTWAELVMQHGLRDFMPMSQDLAAVQLLKRRSAFVLVKAGMFEEAVKACRKEWASLPNSGYHQREESMDRLRRAYTEAGGLIGVVQ